MEALLWTAVVAVQQRRPDVDVWLDSAAEHGRPGVAVATGLLRQATDSLGDRGWSASDIRHVASRRLSAAHADLIATGQPHGLSVREAIGRVVQALALVAGLPEVPAPAGRGGGESSLSGLDPRMVERVRGLLNKAESTDFAEEAEALTAKAQELIARHAIDALLLAGDPGEAPTTRRVHLDDPYVDAKAMLLDRVAGANRCSAVFMPPFGWSEVFGFPADLDAVELLTQSLLAQAAHGLAREGSRVDALGRSRTRSFRRSFLVGFAERIGQRLQSTTDGSVDAAGIGSPSLLPALAARDERVDGLRAETYPQTTKRATSVSNGSGWIAGQAAAEVADLAISRGAVGRDADVTRR